MSAAVTLVNPRSCRLLVAKVQRLQRAIQCHLLAHVRALRESDIWPDSEFDLAAWDVDRPRNVSVHILSRFAHVDDQPEVVLVECRLERCHVNRLDLGLSTGD